MIRNDELGNLATAFNHMSEELWLKSLMKESFGKYVGSEVLEMIMADPESGWLKGNKSEATVLFTDIRGFTSYSEEKEPEEIVEALNESFEIVSNVIIEYGGYIDKFIGDAVMGIFGVPIYYEDHAEKAVRASIDMQKKLLEASKNGNSLLAAIGIGINSGPVVSGNLGSQTKMEYTVIGGTVNLASRLNGLAGSGEVVVSKNIYEKLGDMIEVEALAPTKVKGISEMVESFKVLKIDKDGSTKENNNVD